MIKGMTLKTGLFALGLALAAPGAHAVPLFTLDFDGDSISSNPTLTGASGAIGFSFADEGGDVRVTLDITNTTGQTTFGAGATSSKLTGFGFDLLDGVAFGGDFGTEGFLDTLILNAKFKPFDSLDVAVADNKKFNGGNANGALATGASTTVDFLLDTDLNAASLGDAYLQAFLVSNTARAGLRFQQVNAGKGSDKLIYVGTPPGGIVAGVPVPAALPLLATALAAFGLIGRRQARRRAAV